jgi:hypothetical protein
MGGMRNAERRNGAGRHPRRDRPEVITGEQGDGKLSRPVREGANGKGLRHEHLAGDLLHSMRGGWRGHSPNQLPTLPVPADRVRQGPEVRAAGALRLRQGDALELLAGRRTFRTLRSLLARSKPEK